MALTISDYDRIAAAVRKAAEQIADAERWRYGAPLPAHVVAYRLADIFADDRWFHRDVFLKAAGVTD